MLYATGIDCIMKTMRQFFLGIGERNMARILITVDDEMTCMVTEMLLTEVGYDVEIAGSGEECLRLLSENDYDLLLLDNEMRDIPGLKLLERIRSKEELLGLRTVFLTASSQLGDMTEAIRLGSLDFIKKPALPEDLIRVVSGALKCRHREKILAVDDEPMNLMATENLFGIRYEVHCVSSGREALDALNEDTFDLVLLDLHMPDMDGLEVLKKINETEGLENLSIVFLTADDDDDTEARLFEEGATDYIAKPFVPQVAIQRIRRLMEFKHLRDSLQSEVRNKTEGLLKSNEKIKKLSGQVITALAGAIDAKDSYTNGHSKRVAEYSMELARRLGMTAAECNEIYDVALMHDVGKIGIPDTIINKPGKLTDEEFRIIKSHTEQGYEILKTISELPELSIGARWHHERFDGTGYPDGKAGEDIPEIARIICVADCYDAMSSDRSYRKALPQAIVREEIEKGRGKQFDPRIADVMLMMIDEDREYRMCGSRG